MKENPEWISIPNSSVSSVITNINKKKANVKNIDWENPWYISKQIGGSIKSQSWSITTELFLLNPLNNQMREGYTHCESKFIALFDVNYETIWDNKHII